MGRWKLTDCNKWENSGETDLVNCTKEVQGRALLHLYFQPLDGILSGAVLYKVFLWKMINYYRLYCCVWQSRWQLISKVFNSVPIDQLLFPLNLLHLLETIIALGILKVTPTNVHYCQYSWDRLLQRCALGLHAFLIRSTCIWLPKSLLIY